MIIYNIYYKKFKNIFQQFFYFFTQLLKLGI